MPERAQRVAMKVQAMTEPEHREVLRLLRYARVRTQLARFHGLAEAEVPDDLVARHVARELSIEMQHALVLYEMFGEVFH